MRIPSKARYRYATSKANEFLLEIRTSSLPLDPFAIAEYLDYQVYSYTEAAHTGTFSIDSINKILSSDDGVSLYQDGMYFIIYNDSPESIGRIRFTLFHEIGHIYLNHFTDFEKTTLSRSEFSAKEYKVLENEANCFARNTIAPVSVVLNLPEISVESITQIFQTSEDAAKTRLSFLKSDNYYSKPSSLSNVYDKFSKYLFKIFNSYSCMSCGKIIVHKSPLCCSLCGALETVKLKYPEGVVENLIYSFIQTDERRKPLSCPRCNNEGLPEGNYCNICGTFIFNKCTGLYYGESDQHQYQIMWHSHERGCGNILEGDARFCTDCGSTTTFFEDHLLKSWNDELEDAERNEALSQGIEVPW